MGELDFHSIPDGETLRVLGSGLEIIRREKHEWRSGLAKLSSKKLVQRTSKVWGSKFYPDWTLSLLVEWIAAVVAEEGWVLQPGTPAEADRVLERPVGLAAGEPTHRIRVVGDGRYVHAYPIPE